MNYDSWSVSCLDVFDFPLESELDHHWLSFFAETYLTITSQLEYLLYIKNRTYRA